MKNTYSGLKSESTKPAEQALKDQQETTFPISRLSKTVLYVFLFITSIPFSAMSDCTIPAGTTVVASSTPPCTGTITVNGILQINADFNWTAFGPIIINVNGPGALLAFPGTNNSLHLASGSQVILSNGGLLDVAVPCSNTDKIFIGSSAQAFASCTGTGNSQYSFSQLNGYANSITATVSATPQTLCSSQSFVLNVTASVGFAPQSISWSGTGPEGYFYSNTSNVSSINFTYSLVPGINTYSQAGVYVFTVRVTDGLGNYRESSVTVRITSSCGTVWTGVVNNDWNTSGNWNINSVPASTSNVNIPDVANDPVIVSNVTINNIGLAAGATLTVNSGASLTLNGALTNSGAITINSGGSFLQGNSSSISGSGSFSVKRQGTNNGNNYNYWSTPVASGSVPGSSIYLYNSANGTNGYADDNNPNPDGGWAAFSGAMGIARGYASRGGGLATFSGTPNNGNISYAVTTSGQPLNSITAPSKFNLIGNPYPSSVSASSFINDNAGVIAGSLYFWDDDGSGGSGYTSSDYAVRTNAGGIAGGGGNTPNGNIGSCQGFVVEAVANGNVVFNNAQRGSNNVQFLKTEEEISRIWISLDNTLLYNEILIAFMADATDSRDLLYDAYKLRGSSEIALASMQQEDEFAIAAFPPVESEQVIPIMAYVAAEGIYTITNKTTENMDNIPVYLEDRLTGSFTDLSNNGSYSTLMDPENSKGRFFLHFSPMATTIQEQTNHPFVVFSNGNELNILFNDAAIGNETEATINLFDMSGRLLHSSAAVSLQSSVYKMNISGMAPGMYVVAMESKNNSYFHTRKIILR